MLFLYRILPKYLFIGHCYIAGRHIFLMISLFQLLRLQKLKSVITFLQLIVKTHGSSHDALVLVFGVESWHVTFLFIRIVPIVLFMVVLKRLNFTFSLHVWYTGIALAVNIFAFHLRYIACVSRHVESGVTIWNSIKFMLLIFFVFWKIASVAPCWISWPAIDVNPLPRLRYAIAYIL